MSKTAREVIAAGYWANQFADMGGVVNGDSMAEAIVEDLAAAGFVIVPKEPTEAMKRAWEGPEPWDQEALEI